MAADAEQGEVQKDMSGAEMADRLEAEEAARKLEEDKTTEPEEQLAADLAAAVGLPGDEEEAEEEEEKDEEPEGFVIEDDAEEGGWNPDDMQSLQEDVARTIMGNSSSSSLIALCKVCGKNNAMKNQVFCSSPCGADVRGATRQAKDQGLEVFKAFKVLRKSSPNEFVAAVHIFRAKCASAGRGHKRPEFQWVRYHMTIMLASRLQTGTKSIWMTKCFCKLQEYRGRDERGGVLCSIRARGEYVAGRQSVAGQDQGPDAHRAVCDLFGRESARGSRQLRDQGQSECQRVKSCHVCLQMSCYSNIMISCNCSIWRGQDKSR